jgi:transcriptional regulator with XRE-family HTH domain
MPEDLLSIGTQLAQRRKTLNLSQTDLARKAGISRATLDALENGRAGELGYTKLTKLLAALGLELKLQVASSERPTLDELMQEDRDDKSLDRRR